MIFKESKTKVLFTVLFILVLLFYSFISSSNLTTWSNQINVPLNITVHGKLVLTDSENDNYSKADSTLDVLLKLRPGLHSSAAKSIRIRTNLSNWKLTAQRVNLPNSSSISPEDISLSFTTQAGPTANPNAGKLISPFDGITNLNQISTDTPTEILEGISKTSLDKDPQNKNNWFQLTSNYTILPESFSGNGEWHTIVSYSLVSP